MYDSVQYRTGDLVKDLSSIGRYDDDRKMPSRYIVGCRNSGICRDEYVELLTFRGS